MNAKVETASRDFVETDLKQGRLYLQQTRDALIGSIRVLNAAQWNFKPNENRWSAAQNVEHVIDVQERVIKMVQQDLPAAPPPPPGQDPEIIDGIVINQFPNRLTKFPSPFVSECRFDRAAAVRRYEENCATFAELLTSTSGLRDHALEAKPLHAISNGAYSVMDGYQWILAAAAHAERHTKQILEVIADPSFPA